MNAPSPIIGCVVDCDRSSIPGLLEPRHHWGVAALRLNGDTETHSFGSNGRNEALARVDAWMQATPRLRWVEPQALAVDTYHCDRVEAFGPALSVYFHLSVYSPRVGGVIKRGLAILAHETREAAEDAAHRLNTRLQALHGQAMALPVQTADSRVVAFPFRRRGPA